MSNQELIDRLIATYRDLNAKVRPLPEERLRQPHPEGGSVRDLMIQLRDTELRFSQALKERVTGVPMPQIFGTDEAPVIGSEQRDDPTAVILSQFGTAREATLSVLRALTAEQWEQELEGGQPVRERIEQLVENDRRQMERILSRVGAA